MSDTKKQEEQMRGQKGSREKQRERRRVNEKEMDQGWLSVPADFNSH